MIDHEQGDGPRPPRRKAVTDVAVSPHPKRQRIEPAVAQGQSQTVRAGRQELGHVMRGEENALVEGGPGRIQLVISHAIPVEARHAPPEPRDVQARSRHTLGQHELVPQQGSRIGFVEGLVGRWHRPAIVDPPCTLPVGGTVRRDLPHRRLAPGGRAAGGIPVAHLPMADLAGGERVAGVGHLRRALRDDLAGIPKVRPSLHQPFRSARDQDLPGRLRLVAPR